MQDLTRIQQAVYDYTRDVLQRGKPFPSLREIANHFGFQHTTARFHLKALEKKGYVQQRRQRVSDYMLTEGLTEGLTDGLTEGLTGGLSTDLTKDLTKEWTAEFDQPPHQFDLVARIPAGAPLPVYDETRQSFHVDDDFFGGGEILGVRVVGDSMSGDSIADGDIAMIKRQADANKNDILAIRIEDEITLKRIRLDDDKAYLIPSNPLHEERAVPARQLEILGKLVGIVRKL